MIVSKEFRIGFNGINPDLKVKNSYILTLLAEMAGVHSEKINESFGTSIYHWILTGYKINIIKRPVHGEDVTVITWSADYNPAIAAREFEIRNAEGDLLITGLSNWVLLNFETKRLEKLTSKIMDKYEHEKEMSNFGFMKLPKLTEPTTYTSSNNIFIDWKWMDLNSHMNNTYYMDIADHFLPKEVRENISDYSFEIFYKKEIPEDTQIKCLYEETDNSYVVSFKSEDMSTLHAVVKYQKLS